ncbi:MAG TPA: CoA-transferase [Candidatus Binataceae bacterium]|nr:CoA-transferase [Candidatus Binataceae bacterium]
MSEAYSIAELMAVFLARELNDGETLRVGVASPVPEAAVRLAHLMHGPNMELVFLGARMNVAHLETVPMPAYGWDRRVVRWAESYSDTGHRFDRVKDWSNHVFFIGGVQVDAYGNTNLIGIGQDHRRLKFRGPGSVGTPTLSTHVGRYYIVLNNHNPRVLVEKCDYISAYGWGAGGADARIKMGIPGGGPKLCVTPLCVMDFADDSRRMRLKSLHPRVTVEAVKRATGFEMVIPESVPETTPPNAEELHVLRTRVDREGRLRRE